jgi:DNA-binding NarL/FixJ family response regulator
VARRVRIRRGELLWPAMSDATKPAARAHILVVEDSSVFREMQTLLLGQAGFAVSAHENPQAALDAARKQPFELVLIDYELPEMNGQEFMHALRKVQPDIAVVFVSGALTVDLAIQLSSEGVAGIFNKPANPKILLEKITETLARNAVLDTAARTGSGSPHSSPPKRSSASPFSTSSAPSPDKLAYTPRFLPGGAMPSASSPTGFGRCGISALSFCSRARPAARSKPSPASSQKFQFSGTGRSCYAQRPNSNHGG